MTESQGTATAVRPKFLHVIVDGIDPKDGEPVHVDVRVPFALMRLGVRFANFIPAAARQQVNDELHKQGLEVDINEITPDDLNELIENLHDVSIDVEHKHDNVKVKLYAE